MAETEQQGRNVTTQTLEGIVGQTETEIREIANRFLNAYEGQVAERFIRDYKEDVGRAYIWSGNIPEARQFLNGNFARIADEIREKADKPLADEIGYSIAVDLIREGKYGQAREVANGTYVKAAQDVIAILRGRYNATGDEEHLTKIRDIYAQSGDKAKGIYYTQQLRTAYNRRLQKPNDNGDPQPIQSSGRGHYSTVFNNLVEALGK